MTGKIERLRRELAEAEKEAGVTVSGEPVAWESTTVCFSKYISDRIYNLFSDEAKRWYKPYRCSQCESSVDTRTAVLVAETAQSRIAASKPGEDEPEDRAFWDMCQHVIDSDNSRTQPHALAAAQAENKRLREALIGLDEAYCRAGTGLTRDERTEDRKRLIAARAALSNPADTSELDRLVADAGRAKWQPIETAPKDGGLYLAYSFRFSNKYWLLERLEGMDFWMPLPDAPDAARAEVK